MSVIHTQNYGPCSLFTSMKRVSESYMCPNFLDIWSVQTLRSGGSVESSVLFASGSQWMATPVLSRQTRGGHCVV